MERQGDETQAQVESLVRDVAARLGVQHEEAADLVRVLRFAVRKAPEASNLAHVLTEIVTFEWGSMFVDELLTEEPPQGLPS